MNDPSPEAISSRARADAAAWVVRVHAGDSTEADWLALEAWLGASPGHQAAFDAAERLWFAYDDPALTAGHARHDRSSRRAVDLAARRGQPRAAWWRSGAIAACAVAATAVLAAVLWRSPGPAGEALATSVGQSRLVALADGSQVRLDADTRLTAFVGDGVRRIVLDDGEAEFLVAKDHAHPFVVRAGDEDVTVVGTHFDVVRRGGQITVTVASGVVQVADVAFAGAAHRLTPGDQLRHAEGSLGAWVGRASVDDAFAWTKGYLVFHDAPLAEVASSLSRHFATPMRADGAAARLRFTGVLMLDTEESVVTRLQGFLPVRAVRAENEIVLRPR
jgi:transmembrane sensor